MILTFASFYTYQMPLHDLIWTVEYKNLTYFAPRQSIVQMNGLSSSPNPAITGWQKYGPNLKSKR